VAEGEAWLAGLETGELQRDTQGNSSPLSQRARPSCRLPSQYQLMIRSTARSRRRAVCNLERAVQGRSEGSTDNVPAHRRKSAANRRGSHNKDMARLWLPGQVVADHTTRSLGHSRR
jgi:hypothetical protein